MALGFDQDAACACIRAEVPFVACVPFEGQEAHWPAESQEEYRAILSQAKCVEMLGPKPQSTYEATKLLHARNRHMIDAVDIVIACWDGSNGGTSNAVTYASTQRKRIVYIDPRDYARSS